MSSLRSTPRKRNNIFELRDRFLAQLATRATDLRKLIFPSKRPHRIKDRAAIGMILIISFLRRHARIERCAPATVDDIDISGGSTRVIIAQRTSFTLVTSMSSSTTTT